MWESFKENSLVRYAVTDNRHILSHFVIGCLWGLASALFFTSPFSLLVALVGSLVWEVFEYLTTDIEKTYWISDLDRSRGHTPQKRFFLDSFGDMWAAIMGTILVHLLASIFALNASNLLA